ncbi:hypothetical protein M758_1G162000 [Ceratodon purpureus]|nr:hypothetical protein M758_1G162000 [Ceratodon purpureus]
MPVQFNCEIKLDFMDCHPLRKTDRKIRPKILCRFIYDGAITQKTQKSSNREPKNPCEIPRKTLSSLPEQNATYLESKTLQFSFCAAPLPTVNEHEGFTTAQPPHQLQTKTYMGSQRFELHTAAPLSLK